MKMYHVVNTSNRRVLLSVLGLCAKDLAARGCRGGFCEKAPEAVLMLGTVPASSETDSQLTKAEPISNGGSTSGITYLRRGEKNPCITATRERSVNM